jgi:hypothetical protein
MNFETTLLAYYKGEKTEALLLFVFGCIIAIISVFIWRNIHTNGILKGLFYPMLFLTLLSIFAGGYNTMNNQKRLMTFPAIYANDNHRFIKKEIQRFEANNGVNSWWMPLKITWSILSILGVLILFFNINDFIRGVSLGLIIWGCFGLIVDSFAHQRAILYTAELLKQ